ncbi:MAG: Holliday junction branch migration protein RuvA [bacterium]
MIALLRGKLAVKEPTRIILDVNGIGFELRIPLSTSERLAEPGNEVSLLIATQFTRAGFELFGFATEKEQNVFRLITSVKGVGPRAALNLLSRFDPDEVFEAIAQKDVELLRSVPGIGEKKAAEILKRIDSTLKESPVSTGKEPIVQKISAIQKDAIAALVSLGLSRKEAQERLSRLRIESQTSLNELLKKALAQNR